MVEPNSQESISLNVRVRKTAKELAQLIAGELEQYEEPQRRLLAKTLKRFLGERYLGEQRPVIDKPPIPEPKTTDEVDLFQQQCSDLVAMASEVSGEGCEFAESVIEKVQGISETVGRLCRVTPKQRQAVENMQAGVEKWLECQRI